MEKSQRDRDFGSAGLSGKQRSKTALDDAVTASPGLRPTVVSRKQKFLASVARLSAERRDHRRGVNNLQTPVSSRNRLRERASLTGGLVRQNPIPYSSMPSSRGDNNTGTQSTRSDFNDPAAAPRECMGSEPEFQKIHQSPYMHGYTSNVPWSLELEQLKAPVLTKATPEALIDFRVKWEDYADKIDQLAKKFQAPVEPKAIYDCIEKHNRYYICAVSNLLPRELRGHPDDVSHKALHDLVMTSGDKHTNLQATLLEKAIGDITINLQGKGAMESIHSAWINLSKLQEKYKAEVTGKVVVKKLLGSLVPEKTQKIIRTLQEAGSTTQQATRTNLSLFHDLLVDIAETNRRAREYGFSMTEEANHSESGKGYSIQADNPRINNGERKRTPAAIAEGGCKHHGPGSYHGTSECFIENPSKAPKGWDKKKAIENAKRSKKAYEKRKAEREAKAKANVAVRQNTESSDSEETADEFSFMTSMAYTFKTSNGNKNCGAYDFMKQKDENTNDSVASDTSELLDFSEGV